MELAGRLAALVDAGDWAGAAGVERTLAQQLTERLEGLAAACRALPADPGHAAEIADLEAVGRVYQAAIARLVEARWTVARELGSARSTHRQLGQYLSVAGGR